MRPAIKQVVLDLEPPSMSLRAEAQSQSGSREKHDSYQSTWPCLTSIESAPPAVALPVPASLTIAAWNMERCKRVEDSAALIRSTGADVVLATEVDMGMARSGQRHTTRDLARALGFGYIFGVEFVELGTGDPYETSLFADVPNDHGLHGNAILSRYPLSDPALVPLDDGGAGFVGAPKGDGQFRIGGRMAMTARIGDLTLAAAHYESESDALGRLAQSIRLTEGIDALYDKGPAVIGGDLNTRGFSDAGHDRATTLFAPQEAEPGFAHFEAQGFDWRTANTGAPTLRAAPGKIVRYPLQTIDWLFTRGCAASEPRVVPALCPRGDYLSDHEMILARVLVQTTDLRPSEACTRS